MTGKIKRINNPLTIIAIFAALAEVNATIAIGLIDKELHYIFIWFVILFPTILVILFFVTLNFNTKVMYSPSDYNDDKSFMDSLFGGYYGDKKENKEEFDAVKFSIELENKLTESMQSKLDEIIKNSNSPIFKKEIEALKLQVKSVADQSIIEVKNLYAIPTDLKEILLSFYRFPAFYMIIYALVRSKAKSADRLNALIRRYHLPGGWEESGLPQLFQKEIIIGDKSKFELNPKYREGLEKWVEQNGYKLKVMNNIFRLEEEEQNDENKSKSKERIKEMTERLRF
jgi:hypothetical protein